MDLGDRLRSLNQDISTWKLLSLLLAGGLFGAVVLRADSPWWDEAHKDFAGKSSFVLWGGLICSQTALWALVLAWLGPSVLRLGANYGAENRTEVLASTAMILGIIVLFTVGTPLVKPWPNYMPHHVVKIALLSLVGGFVVLVDALGVWFVHGGLKKLATEELATEKALRTFLALDTASIASSARLVRSSVSSFSPPARSEKRCSLTSPTPSMATSLCWCRGSCFRP